MTKTIIHSLTSNEIEYLLKRFPSFELSYETISHKKVQSEYNIAMYIPIGKKYFFWFSFWEDKTDVLFLMELNKEKKITKIYWIDNTHDTIFDNSLSWGTILYGTFLEQSIFVLEDIYSYKGNHIKNVSFGRKLGFIYDFLQMTFSYSYVTVVKIVLPQLWFQDENKIHIPFPLYPIYHIQYRCLSRISPYINVKQIQKDKEENKNHQKQNYNLTTITTSITTSTTSTICDIFHANYLKPQYKYPTIFQITADIQYDIYHLYAYGKDNSLIYYNIAYIPNLKTSFFMNGLFRNIRENQNIDYIEESDDEDNFEDMKPDKYVDLEKFVMMECEYSQSFKKWIPVKVV